MRDLLLRGSGRWPPEAWVPLLAGLLWLWRAPGHGLPGFLFSVVPGCLLLGSGVSMLLMPGDRRTPQFAAAGGVLGVLFALPAFFVVGFGAGLLLVAASVVSFLAAGFHSVRLEPLHEDVPEPLPSVALAAQVAVDEALLAEMLVRFRPPTREDHARLRAELTQARELFAAEGWLEKPASYHREPPELLAPRIDRRIHRKIGYEHLHFESGYEPHPGEPGRERWNSYTKNRTAHAWVVRHEGEDRPWLMCVHGYVMGAPLVDFGVFRPDHYHDKLGMNLILPTLPLHGRRSVGRRSGEGFFGADAMDMIHAEAQAMWDLRRCLSWVRQQTSQPIGLFGLSLGGYNASLLACLDPGLACVVAGIPVTDFARIVFRHGPPLTLRAIQELGGAEEQELGGAEERMRELKRVISPLDLEPLVPREHRHIFAGVADRIVPPDHARDLWRHWEKPEMVWYQGGHCTFHAHGAVQRMIHGAFSSAGLID